MSVSRWFFATFVVAGLACLLGPAKNPTEGGGRDKGWKQSWADEFDGDSLDAGKWDFDLGNGFYNYDANVWINGWGNNELQYYTREPKNAYVKDGMLHLRAVKESYERCGYTSARIKTRKRDGGKLFAQTYGKFEIRAKMPVGQGVWPALWMLPQDEKYGGWAASGEIDILETKGQEPTKISSALHFGSGWPANTHVNQVLELPGKQTIADFHVYGLEWTPGEIRWSIDGKEYAKRSFWWSSSKRMDNKGARPANEKELNPWPAPFDQPFYLIMNIAVGGGFAGNPDKSTEFPVEMVVDYVRAYERIGGYGEMKSRGPGKLPFE